MSTKMMYARFEDVQVGDTIRIYREIGVDHVQETTAVVERKTTHQLFSVNNRVLYVEGASKNWGTIDILSRPEPVFPRTVAASEVHEHVGCRVTVEGDGYRVTGSLKKAEHLAATDRWLLFVSIPALDRETTLNVPASHPIILEAPANAGASAVGGA